jgi:uncharacterized protein
MSAETAAPATTPAAVKNVVVWFEIPAADLDRAVKFYETVLSVTLNRESMPGWPPMAVFPYDCMGGGVGGCIVPAGEHHQPSTGGITVYLHTGDDLAGPLARVEAAGGKITLPKMQVSPEIGFIAHIIDSEGNRMALHSQN